jgi:hypothetical protein
LQVVRTAQFLSQIQGVTMRFSTWVLVVGMVVGISTENCQVMPPVQLQPDPY